MQPRVQRWSNLTLILLATLTGTTTYVLGLQSSGSGSEKKLEYRDPTPESFGAAMKELREWFPDENLWTDRDSLVSHGFNDWEGAF